MLDLNDLRVFERVASLRSFAEASRTLAMPRSSVSRAIARLETELGSRLLRRTTREVSLTPTGAVLKERCAELMEKVDTTRDLIVSMTSVPRGTIKVAAGVGFGINVLAQQLPAFLLRYPETNVELELGNELADLVADGVDVAVRLGPLRDSSAVAVRLGALARVLCASPSYLARMGVPTCVEGLRDHDWVAHIAPDGRPVPLELSRGEETVRAEPKPRVVSNEALTQFRLIVAGAGMGVISGYLAAPELQQGSLVRLLPEWSSAPMEVSILFPSRRELSPVIRAFVDFLHEVTPPNAFWQLDPGEA